MYRRSNPRPGGAASIAIAHNIRKEGRDGKSVTAPIVIAHLGNEDNIDPDVVDDLIAQLVKVRDARRRALHRRGTVETPREEAVAMREEVRPVLPELRMLCSRAFGMRMLLDAAWRALDLRAAILEALPDQTRDKKTAERMIFGMVLNRLVAPRSKLSCLEWLQEVAWMPEAKEWNIDAFYRSLDLLLKAWPRVEAHLTGKVVEHRFPKTLKHILLDTTSIFTEADMDDAARKEVDMAWRRHDVEGGERPLDPRPQVVNDPPLRMRGHSKDGHPHDPQVVLGLALSIRGDVITHQIFPGNTSDKTVTPILMDQVQALLPDAHVLAVMDAGMGSQRNFQELHDKGMGWLAGSAISRCALVDFALASANPWEPMQRTSHRDRKPKEHTWSLKLVVVPDHLRAVKDQPESVLLATNPERARRDLRKIDWEVASVKRQLAEGDAAQGRAVLNPLLRDAHLKKLVKVAEDGEHIELNDAAVKQARVRARTSAPRQVGKVQAMLSADAMAQRAGVPHMLLSDKKLVWLVRRSEDGASIELIDEAAARARQGISDIVEAQISQVILGLQVTTARVVSYLSHPLRTDSHLRGYIKVTDDGKRVVLDEDAVAYKRARAGLRAIRTTATTLDGPTLLHAYDRLLKAESTFQKMKDILDIRPMYHRAESRIRAHAQVCVLAQRCMHWLEDTTGESWAELVRLFGNIQATQVGQGPHTWWQRSELGDQALEVLNRLGYRPGHERWASDQPSLIMALRDEEV
jgi:hypothetical protein